MVLASSLGQFPAKFTILKLEVTGDPVLSHVWNAFCMKGRVNTVSNNINTMFCRGKSNFTKTR